MRLSVSRAIEELTALRSEARVPFSAEGLMSWLSRTRAVLERSLGPNADIVAKFDSVKYAPGARISGMGSVNYQEYRNTGVLNANALLEAAIYELGLSQPQSDVLAPTSYDAGLWGHVSSLVEGEDWVHVPAAVTIYCEDRIRTWGAFDTGLVGKGLYAAALANDGPLRLGALAGEWEGWKMIGMGLAQAVGNVDRHRLERRHDARAYAIGVLGAGSLLLTQMHLEHADLIAAAEPG